MSHPKPLTLRTLNNEQGRPIYIRHAGRMDMAKILQLTSEERMVKFHIQVRRGAAQVFNFASVCAPARHLVCPDIRRGLTMLSSPCAFHSFIFPCYVRLPIFLFVHLQEGALLRLSFSLRTIRLFVFLSVQLSVDDDRHFFHGGQ
jgi:hypothetical protein